jgi:tetratricopeptide (TPR) repeat protein
LGIGNFKNDCDPEATALEALTKKCGMCTEFTYILYAAFKLAGLAVAGLDVKAPPKYLEQKGLPPNAQHTALVLKLKKGFRIFDFDKGRSDAINHFRENKFIWVQVSEREMISMYYANLAFNICRGSGPADCLDAQRKAQELNPGHYRLNWNLGVEYARSGRLEKAVEFLKKAHELNPGDKDIRTNLKTAFHKLVNSNLNRDNAKALAYCRPLVALEPNDDQARLLMAQLSASLEMYEEAYAGFRHLLKKNPSSRSVSIHFARTLANHGRSLIKSQKYKLALVRLQEARQIINAVAKQPDEEVKEIISYIESLQKFIPTNLP